MPNRFSCLIVEDDPGFASLVADIVRGLGGVPTVGSTLKEAAAATAAQPFDLLLLDNHLPDGSMYQFFAELTRRTPDAVAIMITGAPDLSEAVTLTRNGIFDYLTKPITADALEASIGRALLRLDRNAPPGGPETDFGRTPAMREVLQQLRQAAKHLGAAVLLCGESGVGKDVAARTLHQLTFADKAGTAPYVAVNCAAIPADMFEAELFGAERGAYTGADRRRTGLIAAAQNGTLFLDEIGEVPMALQSKLLRFLEGREFRALGSTESVLFNGRLVAATNKDLHAEVAAGRFREDLLYRIEVFTVTLPPLRDRAGDIPALAETLLSQLAAKYGRPTPLLKPEDLEALTRHRFPGNLRELRNILERSLLRTPEDQRWLGLDRAWLGSRAPSAPSPAPAPPTSVHRPAPTPGGAPNGLPPERSDLTAIEAQEYLLIRESLLEARGGIRKTAAKLGLSPQALLRRLEKWPELRPPQE